MATKRRVKAARRHRLPRVSDRALEIFKQMQNLPPCTCVEPPVERYWEREQCLTCEAWWDLHSDLHHELLGDSCFDWPCIANPETDDLTYRSVDLDRSEMYRELCRLAGRETSDFWERPDIR